MRASTPLPRKLGIRPGHRVVVLDAPAGFVLEPPADGGLRTDLRGRGAIDVVLLFARRGADLRRLPAARRRLAPAGGLWVAWPKKAAKVATDLSFDVVRNAGLALGLVDNKVCAVDGTWSGLRFVIRREDRVPVTRRRARS